jgi:hypothetical protein
MESNQDCEVYKESKLMGEKRRYYFDSLVIYKESKV